MCAATFVTLCHVMFTLCCFTLCSNIPRSDFQEEGAVPFFIIHSGCWAVLSCCLFLVAFVLIPLVMNSGQMYCIVKVITLFPHYKNFMYSFILSVLTLSSLSQAVCDLSYFSVLCSLFKRDCLTRWIWVLMMCLVTGQF